MGTISIQIPQIGQPDTTEDVKVQGALTTIQTVINGNLDTNNISPTAAIAYSQINPGTWTAMTLGTNVSGAGDGYQISSIIQGTRVYFKGLLKGTASVSAGNVLATLGTSQHYPGAVQYRLLVLETIGGGIATQGASVVIQIDPSNGQITASQAIDTTHAIQLHGVNYTIS